MRVFHYNYSIDSILYTDNATIAGTYLPRKEVSIEETVRATIIKSNQAIKLTARKECKDRDGKDRVTGEEWLVQRVGAYLPGAYEEVVCVVDAYVLTEKVGVIYTILVWTMLLAKHH